MFGRLTLQLKSSVNSVYDVNNTRLQLLKKKKIIMLAHVRWLNYKSELQQISEMNALQRNYHKSNP